MTNLHTLNIGDILIRPKKYGLILHYGVVVDNNQVLHNTPENGEDVSTIAEFAEGKTITVRRSGAQIADILVRFRKIIQNPKGYNLFFRNCEHTATEVTEGTARSTVLIWVAILAFLALVGLIVWRKRK